MIFNIPKAAFMAEILLAELIFLFPAEKRSLFGLRYALSFAACLLISVYFPIRYGSLLAQFALFLSLFLISIVFMGLCFRLPVTGLISCCVAGYAVEHIAFHIVKIAMHFGFFAGIDWMDIGTRTLAEGALFPGIYLVFFLTVGLYAKHNECYKQVNMRFNFLSFLIIFLCIGLTRVAEYFGDSNSVTVSLYAIVACGMALFVQLVLSKTVELKHENETIRFLWQEERKQFELSKTTIDTINITTSSISSPA